MRTCRQVLLATLWLVAGGVSTVTAQEPRDLPNVLWITSEDNGPHLGAYGDRFASTPHLDRLAARGIVFWNAWSNAPVCAPARTAIISGLYPTTTGSEHMRSMTRLPEPMRMFPAYLRRRGYYTTNNVKEDYNLAKTEDVWDDSSAKAHWRNRKPGQPFFAVFNTTVTHESSIRQRPHTFVHDPAQVPLPAYHPDTPEVRRDWAQYYDRMSEMDRFVGDRLAEVEADGLADRTIVVYFGDHGPGLPRLKRWPINGGLRVPLIVSVPPRFEALLPQGSARAGRSQRLVSFVDLAPTMLSLAGLAPQPWMQGHAFLGPFATPDPLHAFGFRGRMDERYDLVRSVRDGRYVYIRNYMPHRPYGQYLSYMFQTDTTRVWKRLYDEGALKPPQTFFWEPKPSEELYDLDADPDEVRNLAASPAHREVRDRLRAALAAHLARTRDLGALPEHEMRARAGASTPYELGERSGDALAKVWSAADRATDREVPIAAAMADLGNSDPAVRYWAAVGCLVRGAPAVSLAGERLVTLLSDAAIGPRIAAAEALGRFGTHAQGEAARDVLVAAADLKAHGLYAAALALNAINHLGNATPALKARIAALPREDDSIDARERDYVPRLVEAILEDRR
jgi:uncharacterized sulfatase